jgi:hypothetical protein
MFARVLYPLPTSTEMPSFLATIDIPFIRPTISSLDALELKSSKSIYFPFDITRA